jgi:KipI family sensor histidine kinase inhibitor
MTIVPVGENAILVEYQPEISLPANRRVRQLAYALEKAAITGVTEIVPTYRSLMVYFDCEETDLKQIRTAVEACASQRREIELPPPRLFAVPTVYGGKYGPDLARVAATTGLTEDQVIEVFAAPQYPVYCLGFLCCLAYLGGVPQPLHLPRLTTPRTRLPAGSVGFAAGQAVVLPIDQPSGWHYIGRTFVKMYNPAHSPPTPIRPGDLVHCRRVSEGEARRWENRSLEECLVESLPRS